MKDEWALHFSVKFLLMQVVSGLFSLHQVTMPPSLQSWDLTEGRFRVRPQMRAWAAPPGEL